MVNKIITNIKQGQTKQNLSQSFHTFFPEFTSPRLCASCFKIVSMTNGNSEKLRTQFYWERLCEACTIPTYTGDVLHIIKDQLTAQTMQWTWWVIGGIFLSLIFFDGDAFTINMTK